MFKGSSVGDKNHSTKPSHYQKKRVMVQRSTVWCRVTARWLNRQILSAIKMTNFVSCSQPWHVYDGKINLTPVLSSIEIFQPRVIYNITLIISLYKDNWMVWFAIFIYINTIYVNINIYWNCNHVQYHRGLLCNIYFLVEVLSYRSTLL